MGNIAIIPLVHAVPVIVSGIVTAVKGGYDLYQVAKKAFSSPAPKPAPLPSSLTEVEKKDKRKIAREQLNMNIETDFNMAFCGQLKAGKSRMINAIRGVKKGEAGYAAVGYLRCTMEIEPYRFTDGSNANLVLWDCPGAGHTGCPVKTYFNDKMLYAFDFLLIFLLEAVREEDIEYAKEAVKNNVPFAFVRSKCDVNLAERIDAGSSLEDAKKNFLKENRKAYADQLKQGGASVASAPIFFVSATVLEKSTPTQPNKFKLEEDNLWAYVVASALHRRGCL